MKKFLQITLTTIVVLLAAGAAFFHYWDYVTNPWTRNGQVRAQVIQVAPRVSGPVINLPIKDNQSVKAGDLLFKIDPRTYEAEVKQLKAELQQAEVNVDEAKDEMTRGKSIRAKDKGAMSEQDYINRTNTFRAAQATALSKQASLDSAQLDLEFTEVRASVDGYITNLNLRLGSQAVANQPALALVDVNSYWIHGFFRENYLEGIHEGNRAIVTLMSYPDKPLEGVVDSIGWGIAQQDGSTSFDLLPMISPTFEWIRLAQRIPVRVHLINVPEKVKLRVGSTASVLVMKGKEGDEKKSPAVAAPTPLM